MNIEYDKYTGIERRAKDRPDLKSKFTIQLMRQINQPANVGIINKPDNRFYGTRASRTHVD